ncbi:MAG: hypothetical protein QXH37_05450 [Candidatus Bathyarchaeia archaeon]
MGKKREQKPKGEKLFTDKRLAVVSAAFVSIIIIGLLFYQFSMHNSETEFPLEAAIIDQIGENLPSSPESARWFNETVTQILENAGFNVSYHKSESITVDFYKGLAKYGYGIIVLRAHAAMRKGETEIDFFTSEKFREHSYVDERNNGLITVGSYSWTTDEFFTITPKFIESLEGSFPNSIIVAMGCHSLNQSCTEMAQAFINKGAKAYIGWTSDVSMSHSDNSTVCFLRYLLEENMTVKDAIGKITRDPLYLGRLSYYPSEIGDYQFSNFTNFILLNKTFCKKREAKMP